MTPASKTDLRPRLVAVLQARVSSTRLPGKVLADVCGAPMIARQIERIRLSRMLDGLVVATSEDPSDDPLAAIASNLGVAVHRGSLNDVLSRYAGVVRETRPQHVVRLTGDCPLIDPDVIDAVAAHHLVCRADVTSNAYEPTFPDGLDVEVIRADALLKADSEARLNFEREHVTPFLYDPKHHFRVVHYRASIDLSGLRWTVDEPEDLVFVRSVFDALYVGTPQFRMRHILQLLSERPELSDLNTRFTRNAGLARSIAEEEAARKETDTP